MYTVVINKNADSYYNLTLLSNEDRYYLNIYICNVDGNIGVLISKSEDGFYFKSPCEEANDLELNSSDNLEETYEYVKKHFLNKGYLFVSN
jgi:hypothetical protein